MTGLVKAQTNSAKKQEPIQISGVVMTADSIPQFIPAAHVVVNDGSRGTMTSDQGFFSLAGLPGDTFRVSVIGFKDELLAIPDSLQQEKYLARVMMQRDTTLLKEVTLYPWPSKENFKEEFLATRVPTTEEDIAMRNLAIEELKRRAQEMGYSPEELQDYMIEKGNYNIYNYGRYQGFDNGGTAILGALSNPFAWARFFDSLKNNKN